MRTLCRGPDLHARHRDQDRSPHPPRSRRRLPLRHRHLAAYAGIAPVTHRSASSIRGEHPARDGNKQLKRAFFLSAFAALKDPTSRAYYDRKRAEGKKHNAALICLARRRYDVIFAMLRDRKPYQPRPLPAS